MILTERTYLRSLEPSDLPRRVAWLNDTLVRETLVIAFPLSLAGAQRWYDKIAQDSTRQDFIIVLKGSNEPIGFAGYANIDWFHRKAEPFIAIGEREYWGKGLGTEVVRRLLEYGFGELGLNRQFGFVLSENLSALKMDLRAGYRQEGLLKGDVLIHGRFQDRIMLGVTREEFESARAAGENNP